MRSMKRLGLALLLALYVGLTPFALQGRPLAILTGLGALTVVLFLVRSLASIRYPSS